MSAAAAPAAPTAAADARPRVLTRRRLGLCALSGLLGALAFPLAFPFTDGKEVLSSGVLEPLAFVCLVPALIATEGLSFWKSFWTGTLAGMVFFTGAFWWVNVAMTTFGGMPNYLSIPALELLVGWCAVHWGLAFAVTRFLEARHGWSAAAVFPPVWMASELMRNYFCSGFPWANLGYSQMRNLWLSQVGSLLGVYGVALLVAFVNAALYEVWRWRMRDARPRPVRWMAGAGAALLLGHGYGAVRVAVLSAEIEAAPKVQVAVVQGNIDQKLKNAQGGRAQMILDAYNPPTAAADAAGADLIVWPEASYPRAFPIWMREMPPGGLAKPEYAAHLLLGVDRYDPANLRVGENSAFMMSPQLKVTSLYTKHHLVPFGEYVPLNMQAWLPIDNIVPGDLPARRAAGDHGLPGEEPGGPRDARRAADLLRRHLPGDQPGVRLDGRGDPGQPDERRLVRPLRRAVPVPADGGDARGGDRPPGGPRRQHRGERVHRPAGADPRGDAAGDREERAERGGRPAQGPPRSGACTGCRSSPDGRLTLCWAISRPTLRPRSRSAGWGGGSSSGGARGGHEMPVDVKQRSAELRARLDALRGHL